MLLKTATLISIPTKSSFALLRLNFQFCRTIATVEQNTRTFASIEEEEAYKKGVRWGNKGRIHARNKDERPIAPKFRMSPNSSSPYPTKIVDPGNWYYKPVADTDELKDHKDCGLLRFIERRAVSKRHEKIDLPHFCTGSVVRVRHQQNPLTDKEATTLGIVIGIYKKGISTSFTVRNIVNDIAVEKRFKLYAPSTKSVEVIKYERRNKAKLYYLRSEKKAFSTFTPKNIVDPKKMTPEEIKKHNHLCDYLDYQRKENRNRTNINIIKNILRHKIHRFSHKITQAKALAEVPKVPELDRQQISRMRKVLNDRLREEKKAYKRMKKRRRPSREGRHKWFMARDMKHRLIDYRKYNLAYRYQANLERYVRTTRGKLY